MIQSESKRWLVTQIGARELYAVPRAFHRRGELTRLFTDIWVGGAGELLRRCPGPFKSLSSRCHQEIPKHLVTAFNTSGIKEVIRSRRRASFKTRAELFAGFLRAGVEFDTRVCAYLNRTRHEANNRLFAFSTGALETLRWAHSRGITAVLDQLDPAQADEEMVAEEMACWPGWERWPGNVPDEYYRRLEMEWREADVIVVNSRWSRRSLVMRGVPESKLVVVPLTYEPEVSYAGTRRQPNSDAPFTVLWLGQIILRKGIPYLFEAARRLLGEDVRFVVAGTVGITDEAIKSAPKNLHMLGRVDRAQALSLLRNSHVFVLPTLSDGFALTQLEAMSCGLPVIATGNCGEVVTHGKDGLIIPIRDPDALAGAIMQLRRDPQLLREMSQAAVSKSQQFTLQRYADSLNSALVLHNRG